jgi:hypothetical protein
VGAAPRGAMGVRPCGDGECGNGNWRWDRSGGCECEGEGWVGSGMGEKGGGGVVCASSFFMGFVFWGSGLSAVDPGLVSRLRPAGRPDDGVVRAVVRAVWRAGVASATLLLPGPGVLDRVRARTSSRAGRPGPAS